MKIVQAAKALWYGIRNPERVQEIPSEAATAVFAVAVLVFVLITILCSYTESASPSIAAETARLMPDMLSETQQGAVVQSTTQNGVFTTVLGVALMQTLVSTAVLAALFMILTSFLTNQRPTYSTAIIGVSASALILCIDSVITTLLHMVFGTTQAGLHLGAFVSPLHSPFLSKWLQRFSVFDLWRYIVIGMVICVRTDLHKKYGVIVGTVGYIAVNLLFGAIVLVMWILSLQVQKT